MSGYKVTSFNINSPALQGWDLNTPKFLQGIHALIIWNIIQLKRRERRLRVISFSNPAMNDGATDKKSRHYGQTLTNGRQSIIQNPDCFLDRILGDIHRW